MQGKVALTQNGEAMISLSPLVQMNAAAPPRAAPPTPNPEMVATWEIHSSRRPITRDTMTQAMVGPSKDSTRRQAQGHQEHEKGHLEVH